MRRPIAIEESVTEDVKLWCDGSRGRDNDATSTKAMHNWCHGEEDASPPKVFQQPTADDRSESHGDAGRRAPNPNGLGLLGSIMKDVGKDRQRVRKDDCSADTHRNSGHDQLAGCRSEGPGGRGSSENDESTHERPLATESIAQAARGQDESREGQVVGINDPLEATCRGPQLLDQAREGHVYNVVLTLIANTATHRTIRTFHRRSSVGRTSRFSANRASTVPPEWLRETTSPCRFGIPTHADRLALRNSPPRAKFLGYLNKRPSAQGVCER